MSNNGSQIKPLELSTENTELLAVDSNVNDKTCCHGLQKMLITYFFIIGLLTVVIVAWFIPEPGAAGGILKPEITSSWITVMLIFFINGLVIQTTELKKAAKYWQLSLFIQSFVYIWFPMLG